VLGAVILVIAMVVVLPSTLFMAGALWSALLGQALSTYQPVAGPPDTGGT
jgi:hypothetical protein